MGYHNTYLYTRMPDPQLKQLFGSPDPGLDLKAICYTLRYILTWNDAHASCIALAWADLVQAEVGIHHIPVEERWLEQVQEPVTHVPQQDHNTYCLFIS